MKLSRIGAITLVTGLALGASLSAFADEREPARPPGWASSAVQVIGAWVTAGAPKAKVFDYVGVDGTSYQGRFKTDILPLFTKSGIWYPGSRACASCHFENSEKSAHEMDLSSYEGILKGADVISKPPGVPILGNSKVGATNFNWKRSKLRGRLRNNRMPPGMPFQMNEANRDGPTLTVNGRKVRAVDLMGDWVKAGTPEKKSFGPYKATFAEHILPLFTRHGIWIEGGAACSSCHFGNTEGSAHELNLSDYAGIRRGADVLSHPPGVSIFGEKKAGAGGFNWGHSKLRARLRNNRMPPGMPFDMSQANRDGPLVLHGIRFESETQLALRTFGHGDCKLPAVKLLGAWVKGGAPKRGFFIIKGEEKHSCDGTFANDILPLFTRTAVWAEGTRACASCHYGNTENSAHEMDLSNYAGILKGADVLSHPPGVSILGESKLGAEDFNWNHSKLRGRLRNNRMPPMMPFDVTQKNRDGPTLTVNGKQVRAVKLMAAWVDAGAPKSKAFGPYKATFAKQIFPLFTEQGAWSEGAPPCASCHFNNSEASAHELDLSSYEGILKGADILSHPPGVSILGQKKGGGFSWKHSKLRGRLRNNRMPPGMPFDMSGQNRNGPTVRAGTER